MCFQWVIGGEQSAGSPNPRCLIQSYSETRASVWGMHCIQIHYHEYSLVGMLFYIIIVYSFHDKLRRYAIVKHGYCWDCYVSVTRPTFPFQVRGSVTHTLPSADVHDMPVIVKFLLQTTSASDALEVVCEIRKHLDFEFSFPPESCSTPHGGKANGRLEPLIILGFPYFCHHQYFYSPDIHVQTLVETK